MYRTTRSPMMQPLVNSGMGMAPFFKVDLFLVFCLFVVCLLPVIVG